MLGVPPLGARVKVWPAPGRLVQTDKRPVDRVGGGSWMPQSGLEVEWTTFQQEQLQSGDLLLHAPPCAEHAHAKDGDGKDAGPCSRCGRSLAEARDYDAHAVPARGRAKLTAKFERPALFDPIAAAHEEARALGLDVDPAQPEQKKE